MQTRKHGLQITKLTTLIVIAMSIVLATLTGMLYAHAPNLGNKRLSHQSLSDQNLIGGKWLPATVRRGDTLGHIFGRLKIKQNDLAALVKHHKEITLLHPGSTLYFKIKPNHTLAALKYPINSEKNLVIERRGKNYIAQMQTNPITAAIKFKSAVVTSSLHNATVRSGISRNMLAQMQSIFKNNVNFSHDVHRGDRFAFLYREYSMNGKYYRTGEIVAAEFTHAGKTYRAVRYQYNHHAAYFTPNGHDLAARFLQTPVNYKRISSRFSMHRLDPVLHKVRPHLGIDFAAKSGTPIKSIGDGHVIFAGRENGFGRMVKIRYDRHDVALYAHMYRFAKNLRIGKLVHKGEVIGYVGESGWATGPHLHFGFYVDGVPRNWLAMKMQTGAPIPASVRRKFLATSHQLLAELQFYQDTQFAMNNSKSTKQSS